eukprot:582441-Amphidinium_carterae.1
MVSKRWLNLAPGRSLKLDYGRCDIQDKTKAWTPFETVAGQTLASYGCRRASEWSSHPIEKEACWKPALADNMWDTKCKVGSRVQINVLRAVPVE